MIDLNTLNAPQREAVETINGPLLVLAGAGTGKTRVITYRIANMVRAGINPENILAVTFTNKAAAEMAERVKGLCGKEAFKGLTVSTFHSFCLELLKKHISVLGYRKKFSIADTADQVMHIRKAMREVRLSDEDMHYRVVHSLIGQYKNKGLLPDEVFGDCISDMVGEVYDRYQRNLRATNAVDFDDLLLLARILLKKHKDIRDEVCKKYKYIMVDEYQDTNGVQYDILHSIASANNNLCVVGDDDQSIYGWRGADVEKILNFNKDFKDATVIRLEQNYRSTETILKAANDVISLNTTRHKKSLWSALGCGEKIGLAECEDAETEAQWVASDIQLRAAKNGRPWKDFAILFRKKLQARALEVAMREKDIPYVILGGQSFFDRKEIRDITAYFKSLINNDDDLSFLRIVNTPPRGLGKKTLEILDKASLRKGVPLICGMLEKHGFEQLSATAKKSATDFHDDLHKWKALANDGKLGELGRELVDDINIVQDIEKNYTNTLERQTRFAVVQEFIDSLENYEKKHLKPTLLGFMQDMALMSDADTPDKEKQLKENRVALLTLHASKGLEFLSVYLVGLEDGVLPSKRTLEESDEEDDTEERRLFYVGITRAQERLVITRACSRTVYGKTMPTIPSRFLKDISEEFTEKLISQKTEQELREETIQDTERIIAMLQAQKEKK